MIWLPSGGSRSPSSAETVRRGEHFIRMEGRETYRYATRTLASSALAAIEQAGWTARPGRPLHPAPGQRPHHRGGGQGPRPAHGARCSSTSTATATRPPRRSPSRSTRPSASGRIQPGDKLVLVAFGAGFTSGAGGHHLDRRPGRLGARRDVVAGGQRARAARLGLRRPDAAAPGRRARGPGRPARAARRRRARRAGAMRRTEGPRDDRPVRQDRRRHGRLARDRPRHRPAARDTGRRRLLQLPRQRRGGRRDRGGRRGARPAGARGPGRRLAARAGAAALVKAALEALRQGRHPRQQRGHHARRPHHAHEPEAWTRCLADEPLRAPSTPSRP